MNKMTARLTVGQPRKFNLVVEYDLTPNDTADTLSPSKAGG